MYKLANPRLPSTLPSEIRESKPFVPPGTDLAVPNKFDGPVLRVKPGQFGAKIEGHSARLWDGKPLYQTAWGYGR